MRLMLLVTGSGAPTHARHPCCGGSTARAERGRGVPRWRWSRSCRQRRRRRRSRGGRSPPAPQSRPVSPPRCASRRPRCSSPPPAAPPLSPAQHARAWSFTPPSRSSAAGTAADAAALPRIFGAGRGMPQRQSPPAAEAHACAHALQPLRPLQHFTACMHEQKLFTRGGPCANTWHDGPC